jgi:hypothetical protein
MRISKTVTSRLIYCDILSQNLANRRNWINRKGEVCLQILEEGRPMSASQCCAAHTPGHCCRGRYGRHRHRENQLVMDAIRVTCSLDRSGHRSCCRRRLGFGVILPEIASGVYSAGRGRSLSAPITDTEVALVAAPEASAASRRLAEPLAKFCGTAIPDGGMTGSALMRAPPPAWGVS